jgi:hypothetical protein
MIITSNIKNNLVVNFIAKKFQIESLFIKGLGGYRASNLPPRLGQLLILE